MSNVSKSPESGKLTDPNDTLPPEAPLTEPPPASEEAEVETAEEPLTLPRRLDKVDFSNPNDVREWLGSLRSTVEDLYSIGHEATKRPRKRVLSRFEARRQLEEAMQVAKSVLAAGERSLRD